MNVLLPTPKSNKIVLIQVLNLILTILVSQRKLLGPLIKQN